MKKIKLSFILMLLTVYTAIGQFAPPAGQAGTTAIHKDSSVFISWAISCSVVRGYQDINDVTLGYTSVGDSLSALGIADGNVVSLGDGGYALLSFANGIANGPGWDFAVFENAFNDTFLELAFVEVSSDGINFFRFPATSYTQDTIQVGTFGSVDATKINNLAGKYRANYGTPFDLQELSNTNGLDINHITHIKIIDAVGCIQNTYATYDQYGNKINDPWNTPFASGGFDLDAIGVINEPNISALDKHESESYISVSPNPFNQYLKFTPRENNFYTISIYNLNAQVIYTHNTQTEHILDTRLLEKGIYIIQIKTSNHIFTQKLIKN